MPESIVEKPRYPTELVGDAPLETALWNEVQKRHNNRPKLREEATLGVRQTDFLFVRDFIP